MHLFILTDDLIGIIRKTMCVAQWLEMSFNTNAVVGSIIHLNQAFNSSEVGKLVPILSERIKTLVLSLGNLPKVVKLDEYEFNNLYDA